MAEAHGQRQPLSASSRLQETPDGTGLINCPLPIDRFDSINPGLIDQSNDTYPRSDSSSAKTGGRCRKPRMPWVCQSPSKISMGRKNRIPELFKPFVRKYQWCTSSIWIEECGCGFRSNLSNAGFLMRFVKSIQSECPK